MVGSEDMKIDNELICLGEIGKVTTIAMEGKKSSTQGCTWCGNTGVKLVANSNWQIIARKVILWT